MEGGGSAEAGCGLSPGTGYQHVCITARSVFRFMSHAAAFQFKEER